MLTKLLDGCSQVQFADPLELFNINNFNLGRPTPVLDDPVRYILDRLYGPMRSDCTAFGFKLFYYHATKGEFVPGHYPNNQLDMVASAFKTRLRQFYETLDRNYDVEELAEKMGAMWARLRDDKALRIIHLKRENKLRMLLSLRRSYRSDLWDRTDRKKSANAESRPSPITITVEDCLEAFSKTAQWEVAHEAYFQNHKLMSLTYEELCSDPPREITRVLDFLAIADNTYETPIDIHLDNTPLHESIQNYSALKERFEESEWSEYFVD